MSLHRRPRLRATRWAASAGLALALVGLLANPASAHVEATLVDLTDDGIATVELSFHHGCDGQPTTSLRVEVPDHAADASPRPVEGWTVSAEPGRFGWEGGSVPDGESATFTATVRVWGSEGDVIWLKTLQGCPTAEEPWLETHEPGSPEPEYVAPSIVLPRDIAAPATSVAPETSSTSSSSTTSTTFPNVAITEEGSPRNNVGLLVGGGAMAVIAVGAVVLYLRHRQPR